LSTGKITFFIPSLYAAIIFSFNPPIFITFPFNEISPVIATCSDIFLFNAREINPLVIAIPAEGPSFGVAPSGTCICMLFSSK